MSDFVTPAGRLSFPNLFEPKPPSPGADPKYSCTVLLPKGDKEVKEFMGRVNDGIMTRIAEKWSNPDRRPAELNYGIKDGDKAKFTAGVNAGKLKCEKYPEMANSWVIQASTKQKPQVLDANGAPVLAASDVYPGCWVRISFNLFAYDNVNVGVSCGLQHVMKVRDGDPFGNSSRPEDDFGAFFGQVDTALDGGMDSTIFG